MKTYLRHLLSFAAFGLAGLLVSGCASIVSGRSQSISVRSDPSQADVTIIDSKTGNTITAGKTPLKVSLDKGSGYFSGGRYRLILDKPGYERCEYTIDSHLSTAYVAGNLIFGSVVGWFIVDPATGAMWTLDPDDFSISLKETPTAKPAQPADKGKPIATAPGV